MLPRAGRHPFPRPDRRRRGPGPPHGFSCCPGAGSAARPAGLPAEVLDGGTSREAQPAAVGRGVSRDNGREAAIRRNRTCQKLLEAALEEPGLKLERAMARVEIPPAAERGGEEVARQDVEGQTPGRQIPAAVELTGRESHATSSGFTPAPTLLADRSKGCIHVERVPQHQHVDHQTQRPQLVFLAFPVALPDLAPLTMENRPGHAITALTPVQLREDSPAKVARHLKEHVCPRG